MLFKDKLKKVMQELQINQIQLSRVTGIGKSSICQYLSGKNVPSEKRKEEIATALNLRADFFQENKEKVEKNILHFVERKGRMKRLTPEEVADIMGTTSVTIRTGLQDGVFPWGYAIRGKGEKFVYIINAQRFSQIEGIEIQ